MDTHAEAIEALSFVHEQLATGDPYAGRWFVPKRDFDRATQIRVTIDTEETVLYVFAGMSLAYQVNFQPRTPATVVNQAVAAAIADTDVFMDEYIPDEVGFGEAVPDRVTLPGPTGEE